MIIKIVDIYPKPGDSNKVIYKDDKGREFLGPRYNVAIGDIINIDGGERLVGGYYPFKKIRFIVDRS